MSDTLQAGETENANIPSKKRCAEENQGFGEKRKHVDSLQPDELSITVNDIGEFKDPKILAMKANRYMKRIISEWETKATTQKDKSLLLETKKSLLPMFVLLRKGTIDLDQLTSLLTILHYLQGKNYLKATESYMQLSIGNTAWPIGVMSVSIHARSRDNKINGGKSNIMIDEKTRRWITAVKRLISYCEENKTGQLYGQD